MSDILTTVGGLLLVFLAGIVWQRRERAKRDARDQAKAKAVNTKAETETKELSDETITDLLHRGP